LKQEHWQNNSLAQGQMITVHGRKQGPMAANDLAGALFTIILAAVFLHPLSAQTRTSSPSGISVDTASLNRNPSTQAAFAAFYNMDYDGAMVQFRAIAAEHPDDPLPTDFLLDDVIFKELNRLDLLDTTFYANDGFLTGKHTVNEAPAIKAEIDRLSDKAVGQANTLLAKNPNDRDALYARAWARSLQATYIAFVERGFSAALRLALAAKNDDEAVLKLDPNYVDADLVVGNYQYVVGSLPLSFRLLIGIAGITGSKDKGMDLLQTAAAHGVRTSVEARTCMMLFLRREAKYGEAENIARTMAVEYPHDYLFQLELANLEKDSGDGDKAIVRYEQVIAQAKQPDYFHSAHLELAYFGLGDTLSGQKQYARAAEAFKSAAYTPTTSLELKQRCLVNAGKSYDLLHDHAKASQMYQEAIDAGGDTTRGQEAKKLLRKPYTG
jgi:tetratricopeptide (TPR) repeat protein